MKVKELIKLLQSVDPEKQVRVSIADIPIAHEIETVGKGELYGADGLKQYASIVTIEGK